MSKQYKNFGEFIALKRKEKKITLREMAKRLSISPPYLSDVEKDHRNPFDLKKLKHLADVLMLSEEDMTAMFDLAGKKRNEIAPDLKEYIIEREYGTSAIRVAKELNVGKEEWSKFIEELKIKRKKATKSNNAI